MPSKTQLETALINADKAGDVQAATMLANALKNNEFDVAGEPSAKPVIPELSNMAQFGRGMMDTAQGIKQIGLRGAATGERLIDSNFRNTGIPNNSPGTLSRADKDYTQKVANDLELYEQGREKKGDTGLDIPRIGGNIASTWPIGLQAKGATAITDALKMGAEGSVAAGLQYTPSGNMSDKLMQMGAGFAGGVIAKPIMSGVGSVAGSAINTGKSIIRNIKPTSNQQISVVLKQSFENNGIDFDALPIIDKSKLLAQAKAQLKQTGGLDGDSLVRSARAEALGFSGDSSLTQSQVTRSPKMWTRERNLSKVDDVGDSLIDRYQRQDAQFNAIGSGLSEKTGGKALDINDTNESIVKAIHGKWQSSQKEVGKIYKQIDDELGDIDAADLSNVSKYLDDIDYDETITPVTKSVRNLLKKHGVISLDDTGNYVSTGKLLTVKEAESIRKAIGGIGGDTDPSLMRAKRNIINVFDESAIDSYGSDLYSSARKAAATRFDDFESKIGNTMKKITKETLSEDDAFNSVLKSKSEELQAIKDNLLGANLFDDANSSAGSDAFANIQKQTIDKVWTEANRTGSFSGNTFKKELDKIGRKKLEILFGKDQAKQFYDIAETGLDMTKAPPYSSVNYSNTTPTLLNMIGSTKIPWLSNAMKKGTQEIEVNRLVGGAPINKEADLGATKALLEQMVSSRFGRPVVRSVPIAGGLLADDSQERLRKSLLK